MLSAALNLTIAFIPWGIMIVIFLTCIYSIMKTNGDGEL